MQNSFLRRRKVLLYLGLGALGAGAAAIAPSYYNGKRTGDNSSPIVQTNPSTSATVMPTPNPQAPQAKAAAAKQLPEFQEISHWFNSAPLTIADLKGQVVLIQFWTFACINCQRTLPYVVQWHQQYADKGLKVIGIHTPEFAFERDLGNISAALEKHQITYPVPVDNGHKTWAAYENEYWPHLFLADRQGNIRYDHIGEGSYTETEAMIRQLLAEKAG